ncbi:hypothetical protein ATH84_10874 [Paracoccus versutus]|uniref:Uncharacterized protein n=1 Tax=Paracoccus versutus TaxID=34007 RepID=A0AAQ0HDA7_PARVE|nr:hypothetical protein IT40_16485 [Paracoccus versutus]REG26870.1 hypothetical protein ATH84_10874 [Paracoccus versutus]
MLGKASIEQSPHNYFGIFSALQNALFWCIEFEANGLNEICHDIAGLVIGSDFQDVAHLSMPMQ